jgi:hypothetical protein
MPGWRAGQRVAQSPQVPQWAPPPLMRRVAIKQLTRMGEFIGAVRRCFPGPLFGSGSSASLAAIISAWRQYRFLMWQPAVIDVKIRVENRFALSTKEGWEE